MFSMRLILSISLYLLFSSGLVYASGSGGYRDETPDAGAFGMGSAFVGEADTPAAVYYNPAGMNQMSSTTVSIGDAVIAPRAEYINTSGDTTHQQNNEYDVPNFYAVVPIIPNKLTVGVDGGSYWGLGENWADDSNLKYAITQATLENLDDSLAAAYQVTNQWSLAASLDNDFSRVNESKEFSNSGTTSGPNGTEELRASTDGLGYRLATMFKINDQNQVGLMYRSRINEDYSGKAAINGMVPGVSEYYGFGGGPSFITAVKEKTVLPQSVVFGYDLKPTAKWTINADLEWMDWSSTKYETLTFPNATAQQLMFLNSGNPVPEDWHSALSESIGTQYDLTDRFRVRLGYYHHGKVIPADDFNGIIQDSSSNGYTTGFGFDITKRLTLDVAYSLAVYQTRDITNNYLSTLGGINGKYYQYLNIGLVSLTYKF